MNRCKIIVICCLVSFCHFPMAEPRKRGRDKLPIKDEIEAAAAKQQADNDKRKKASGKYVVVVIQRSQCPGLLRANF